MIVTIDGPAGAGKSTVARALAGRLGFLYLDTGAMYRAVALAGLRRGVDWEKPDELAALAPTLSIELDDDRIFLDGEDVSRAIRTQEVTRITRFAAGNPDVRRHLVDLQRRLAEKHDAVTEGRDQGTVAFPKADCKIYLTASPTQRAKRRLADLEAQGESATLENVLAAQEARDHGDASREVGPLAKAADAVEVVTDGLSIDQVVDRLVSLVRPPQAP
ncbi:MAG: (d)CMP kinase [Pirellulales bacterium]|nr:(d)CMP kinase [Pirellulales bacterium]